MNIDQKLNYVYEKLENMTGDEFADFIMCFLGEEYLFEVIKDSLVKDDEIDIAYSTIKDLETLEGSKK
jgi:hypothetical protein